MAVTRRINKSDLIILFGGNMFDSMSSERKGRRIVDLFFKTSFIFVLFKNNIFNHIEGKASFFIKVVVDEKRM
jgi:hypothetical protein